MSGRSIAVRVGLVLALAAYVRLAHLGQVIGGGRVVPLDGDSLYHLHRMMGAAQEGLRVAVFDPLMNWPFGGYCHWAPGFDVAGAILAWPFRGSRFAMEAAACVLPVLLGVLLVGVAIALARRLEAAWSTALAAGILAALEPLLVDVTRFARTDHHAWEALSMALLALWVLPRAGEDPLRREICGALVVGASLWGFDGAPLYVALAAAVLVGRALACARPPLLGSGALGLLAGAILAGISYAPAIREHGRLWSFVFPSLLQPALVAFAGAGVALAVFCARTFSAPARRLPAFAMGTAFIAAALALALPAAGRAVAGALGGWLARRDPWLSTILEFQPLFARGSNPLQRVATFFGAQGFLFPLLAPFGLALAARRDRGRGLSFAFLVVALAALTLHQVRFGRVAGTFASVAIALGFESLALGIARRAPALVLGAAMLVALADPEVRGHLEIARSGEPLPAIELAMFLRDRTPLQAPGRGPGVLAPWDLGHEFEVVGERPVVANGFGPYLDARAYQEATRAFIGSAAELDSLFARRDLGWLVAGAAIYQGRVLDRTGRTLLERAPDGRGAVSDGFLRQYPLAVTALAGSGVPDAEVHHLEHLWPRASNTLLVEDLAQPMPRLWLFERVAGARVAGRAGSRERVVAALAITDHGNTFPYRAWTDAGEGGAWALVLPIPGNWLVRAAGESRALAVTEGAVRSGANIQW